MLQQPPSPASPPPSALNREAAALPSASAAVPAPVASETVTRPAGLRHGRWEARPSFFFAMGGTVLFLGLVYALFRTRIVRLRPGAGYLATGAVVGAAVLIGAGLWLLEGRLTQVVPYFLMGGGVAVAYAGLRLAVLRKGEGRRA